MQAIQASHFLSTPSSVGLYKSFINGTKITTSVQVPMKNKKLAGVISAQAANRHDLEYKPPAQALPAQVMDDDQVFAPSQLVLDDRKYYDLLVPQEPHHSLARHHYGESEEDAINGSINVAYNMSYIFHSIFTYFDRDNVALLNVAHYFLYRSGKEREEAERLMHYQNLRGGHVKLQSLHLPDTEFADSRKGDALEAFELGLAMEKIQNEKYLAMHNVAQQAGDPEMEDFVKKAFLHPQTVRLRRSSDFVSKLRRVGAGHGTWHFDKELGEYGDDFGFSYFDPVQ
eukprot:jgi/Mesen1/4645/ME000241S03683